MDHLEDKKYDSEVQGGGNAATLLRRVHLFLEDGDWSRASDYCERVLDIDPENAEAYLCKLMTVFHVRQRADLGNVKKPLEDNGFYQKAIRFGDESLAEELRGYIKENNQKIEQAQREAAYRNAEELLSAAKTEEDCLRAAEIFASISGFEDADDKKVFCDNRAKEIRANIIAAEMEEKRCREAQQEAKRKKALLAKKIAIPGSVLLIILAIVVGFFIKNSIEVKRFTYKQTDGGIVIAGYNGTKSKIKIPSKIDGHKVVGIGGFAFYECSNITSVTIPNGVTSIGEEAFAGCFNLTNITIPGSVTSVAFSAFANCKIEKLIIADGSKTITLNVVKGVDKNTLKKVEIPNSVTSIGHDAFLHCKSLTSITIPKSVTSIGQSAFFCCDNLVRINFNGTKAQWNAIEKESYWDYGTGKYTIYCTDGNISK